MPYLEFFVYFELVGYKELIQNTRLCSLFLLGRSPQQRCLAVLPPSELLELLEL